MTTRAIVGPFVKSSASGQQDNCVEVAPLSDGGRAVRDSKDKTGPILQFTPTKWAAFVVGVKASGFEL
ncbi:DUF397 domain-containing protein [Streptomyces sp. NPDC101175]|uniref:DUF397 domain-containing protein n=1 Tax=Streptomyces sp. NPDC101175 TaxID=3366123 RepID=UPI003836E06E